MTNRIEPFSVTIPAATTIAAPQTTTFVFNDGIVRHLDITVPPGPSGLVGFVIVYGTQTVIPYKGSNWIIADNRIISWDLDDFPTGRGWGLRGYNLDIYPHTIYLEFHVDEIPIAPTPLPTVIPIG